jgi:hypothetical protein
MEGEMRLTFVGFEQKGPDGRRRQQMPVIDDETGKQVGHVLHAPHGCVYVHLFDGKYDGKLNDWKECKAFIKGVETVLNRLLDEMLSSAPPQQQEDAA